MRKVLLAFFGILLFSLILSGCSYGGDELPPIILITGDVNSGGSGSSGSNSQFLEHYDDCGGAVCGYSHHYDT